MGIAFIAFSLMAYSHKEDFGNLDFCNTNYTTADWNTDDSIGAPGRIPPRDIASYPNAGGKPVDVVANGPYVFAAAVNDGGSGGGIYIQNAETYAQVSYYATDDNEQGVAIYGRYAYLVDDGGEITRVDCGDLSSSPLGGGAISTETVTGTPDLKAIVVSDDYMYLAAGGSGIYTKQWGVAAGAATNPGGGNYDLALFGRYLLVADGTNGLRIYAIGASGALSLATTAISGKDCRGVSVSGYHAIVAAVDSMFALDLSVPGSPSVAARYGTAGNCYSACEQSGKLYAACGDVGTMVYSGSAIDELRPIGVSQNLSGGKATSIVPITHQVAIADSNGNVQFLSIGPNIQPAADWDEIGGPGVDYLDLEDGNVLDMVVVGDFAYISVQTEFLVAVDLTDYTKTTVNMPAGADALGLCAAGNMVFQAIGHGGVRAYNVATHISPTPSTAWTLAMTGDAAAWCVDTDGNYVYVGTGTPPYAVYKIRINDQSVVASEGFDAPIYGLDVDGGVIYVAADTLGLISMDIDMSGSGYDTLDFGTRCWGVIAENNYAYASCFNDGLYSVDISDPTDMSSLSHLSGATTGYVLSLFKYDNYLIIGRDDISNAMLVADASDPTSLTLNSPAWSIEGVNVPSDLTLPGSMVKYHGKMLVTDYAAGLRCWDLYPTDCTDSLVQYEAPDYETTMLYSNKVNTSLTSGVQLVNWKSYEYYPTDDKDTINYWIVFVKDGGATRDSLEISYIPSAGYATYVDPVPPPWSSEGWYWLSLAGYDDIYWRGDIKCLHDVWADPAGSGPYTGVWFADTVWVGYRRLFSRIAPGFEFVVHVDFGGGEETDIVLGIDSTATDRYDPGMDIAYVPSGPGPHAYWALDDPEGPPGVALSACYIGTELNSRPLRLVLSDPATLTWTVPPEMEEGDFVLDGVDMTTTTVMDIAGGEHRALPNSGVALFHQITLDRGWNMISPVAMPLCETTSDVFGVNVGSVWSYDDSCGGFYNTGEVGDGKGYFVLSTSRKMHGYHGVRTTWTRTEIHRGWNLIGGPSDANVHISSFITEPDSIIWPSPLYTLNSTGDYDLTEWTEPGKAYWIYALDDGVLYIDSESGTRKAIPLDDSRTVANLELSSPQNTISLVLGIDNRASSEIDTRFDRLLPPSIPGKHLPGWLTAVNSSIPLYRDVRQNMSEWNLVVNEPINAGSDVPLLAVDGEKKYSIDATGTPLNPGIYKITLSGAALPEKILIDAFPNPFNAKTLIRVLNPYEREANLSIFDVTGRRVAGLFDGFMPPGGRSYLWDAIDESGEPMPTGIYFVKLSFKDGPTVTSKLVLIK